MEPIKVQAMIHSLQDKDEATIISHKDNNNVVAEYNGQRCTAIFNIFNGLFFGHMDILFCGWQRYPEFL